MTYINNYKALKYYKVENILYKKELCEKVICFGVILILFNSCVNASIYALCDSFMPTLRPIFNTMLFAVESVVLGLCYICAIIKKPRSSILISALYIILLVGNYIFFPDNQQIIMQISRNYFLFCMPAFVLTYSIDNFSLLKNMFFKAVNVCFICCVIIYFFDSNVKDAKYSMWFSYQLGVPGVYFSYQWFNKFKLRYLGLVVACIAMILIKGARGPLVCILSFILIYSVNILVRNKFIIKLNWKKIIFYLYIFLGLVTVIVVLYKNHYLDNILNLNSRTISTLLDGSFFTYTSGREVIYQESLASVLDKPVLGLGMGGDRLINGIYSHNIFIELIACFGYIFGGLLCAIVIYLVIRVVFSHCSTDNNRINMYYKELTGTDLNNIKILNDFQIIFLCVGFVTLLMSLSLFEGINFHMFLGLALNSFWTKKYNNSNKKIEQ